MNGDNAAKQTQTSAWDTCVSTLERAFLSTVPQETDQPLATKQIRYFHGSMAVARMLKDTGNSDLAAHFHLLAEALYDLAEGKANPLFEVERGRKRGSPPDVNSVWRIRANVCVAIEYMIAGGKTEEETLEYVFEQHGDQFSRLIRPDSKGLDSSLLTWLKSFRDEAVANDAAQKIFKYSISSIEELREQKTGQQLQQFAKAKLKSAANDSSDLPRKAK
jgi:hypothetical protein